MKCSRLGSPRPPPTSSTPPLREILDPPLANDNGFAYIVTEWFLTGKVGYGIDKVGFNGQSIRGDHSQRVRVNGNPEMFFNFCSSLIECL